MATAQASLNDYRQSPRKVRLVADYMRGKSAEALAENLNFVDKRAAAPLKKLLKSALANAKDLNIPTENLVVKSILVDGGKILYRRLPASRGRATTIRKRTSKVTLVLAEGAGKKSKAKTKKAKK
jgi:large subunit ribosomal protein L22